MEDGLILNIAVPSKKPAQTASPSGKKPYQAKRDNFQRPDKRGRDNGPQKFGRQDRNFGRQDRSFDRSGDHHQGISHSSKKISKQAVKVNKPVVKEIEHQNMEELLDISAQVEQKTDIFAGNKFSDVPQLTSKLVSTLEAHGFTDLTNIQKESIPVILKGTSCLIKSETGSGKTLAYLVPIVNMLSTQEPKISREEGTYCVVISPTRELCVQIVEQATIILKKSVNLICGAIMGGEAINKEKSRLRKGITILVCTPGRLVYHLKNTASFGLDKLKFLVFEESDRTLDMGFKKDLEEIIDILSKKTDFEKIQKFLISANYNQKVEAIWLKLSASNHKLIGFNDDKSKEETNEVPDSEGFKVPVKLAHKYILVEERKRISFLLSILMYSGSSKIIIFVATCDEVEFFDLVFNNIIYQNERGDVTEKLIKVPTFKLHGKIDQKSRTQTYLAFKKAKEGILISTDVASRGLDFDDVKLIVQFDPPETITDYVNRMGRTARIGNYGLSLIFLNEREIEYVQKLEQGGLPIERYDEDNYYQYVEAKIQKDFNYEYSAHAFLDGLLNNYVHSDHPIRIRARKAYVSYLRAYGRHKEKTIFHPKRLNLKHLAKSFGLAFSQTTTKELKDRDYLPDEYDEKMQKKMDAKKGGPRKMVSSRALEKMEFL